MPVGPGEAIRIMTGAPVPDGADAIVMVEDTAVGENGDGGSVIISKAARPGDHIRRAGGDLDVGDPAIAARHRCSARPTSGWWPASGTPR